jgi:hypothetical protein
VNWSGASIFFGLLAVAWTAGTPWGWLIVAALALLMSRG